METDDEQVANQRKRSRGATAVEYALIIALIAAIIIAAVGVLGTKTQGSFDKTNTELGNYGA